MAILLKVQCISAGCKSSFFILLIFAAKIFILTSVKNNLNLLIGLGAVVLENVRKSVDFPARCSLRLSLSLGKWK